MSKTPWQSKKDKLGLKEKTNKKGTEKNKTAFVRISREKHTLEQNKVD